MLVRWREGHLMGPDLGHIPVSNLYEVFVLFALITALFYLYYERKYATRALGGFVLLVVTSAVVFLLWYSFTRDAGQIQPLVPALKSWWMSCTCRPTSSATAPSRWRPWWASPTWSSSTARPRPGSLAPLFVLGVLLCAEPMVFRSEGLSATWMLYFGIGAVIVGAILLGRRRIAAALPSLEVLDDIMYRAIAIGFASSRSPPSWARCGRPTPGAPIGSGIPRKPGR